MNIYKKFNTDKKEDLVRSSKDEKIQPFFRLYQKFVRHNIINKTIYVVILIYEFLQIYFEITFNGVDYIKNSNSTPVSTVFKFLQYINFHLFVKPEYINITTFGIIYGIVGFAILSNFLLCLAFDILNKKWVNKRNKFHLLHSFLGFYNFINKKTLLIPFNYVLFKSFSMSSFHTEIVTDPNSLSDTIGFFNDVVIKLISSLLLIINFIMLLNTSLLYNDIDPIHSPLCWAQSYPEIELYNVIIKHITVIMNVLQSNFFFMKSTLIFSILTQVCTFRFIEWYYSWPGNKILLTIFDFSLFFINLFYSCFYSTFQAINGFINLMIFSFILALVFYFLIEHYHNRILFGKIETYKTEWDFCLLIVKLIQIMKKLPSETKTIQDSYFFGFLSQHNIICKNNPSCTQHIFNNLMNKETSKFENEIEEFTISRSEMNIYRRT